MKVIIQLILIALICSSIFAGEIVVEPSGFLPIKANNDGPVSSFCLKYELPDSLKGKFIVFAFLELETDLDTAITSKITININPLKEQWTSSLIPQTKISFEKVDSLLVYRYQEPDQNGVVKFDVTLTVTEWLNNKLSNNGFLVTLRKSNDLLFKPNMNGEKASANLRIIYETLPE